jgi:hypothetical protein
MDRYVYIYIGLCCTPALYFHTQINIYIKTYTHTHKYVYIYTHTHVLSDLLLIYICILHACLAVCVYIYALHFKALLRHLALVFQGLFGLKHFIVVRLYYGTCHWCLKGLLD